MKRAMYSTFLILVGCALARADGFPPPIELPTFKAGVWTYEITPDGTINRRYVSLNEAEKLEALTGLAQQAAQRRREQLGSEQTGDPSREVRREVLCALINYCDRAVKPVDELTRPLQSLEQQAVSNDRLEAVNRELDAVRKEFLATYQQAAIVMGDEYYVVRRMWIDVLPRYANGADVLAVACAGLYDSHDGVRAVALRVLGQLQHRATKREELDDFRRRVATAVPRTTELLGDYYTPVREQAVAIFENVTGTSVEAATGRSAEDWRRAFPRHGDPRSPRNAYWSSLGD